MGRVLWAITVLTLGMVITGRSEHLDVYLMYRYHEEPPRRFLDSEYINSTNADLEYHARTNGLGRILALSDSLADPNASMPAFGCVSAGSLCSWQKNGWVEQSATSSSSFPKLGVSQEGILFQKRCPPDYILKEDGTGCNHQSLCRYILWGFTGKISSPNYPSSYPNNADCSWLISPPTGHLVSLTFSTFSTEQGYDRVDVHDGSTLASPELGTYSGQPTPPTITSSTSKMLVTFKTDSSGNGQGFMATFSRKVIHALVLTEDRGTLTSLPVVPTSDNICVSIIYKLAPEKGSKLSVSALLDGTQEVRLPVVKRTEVDDWRIDRLRAPLPPHSAKHAVVISVSATGKGSAVFSIVSCSSIEDEDVYLISENVPDVDIPHPKEDKLAVDEGGEKQCHNGGRWDTSSEECICAVGFAGTTCEEGCGPNNYGNDCGGVCSYFGRGCEGIVFCKREMPCMCAPGLRGSQCDSPCSSGSYGNGCSNRCGYCSDGYCDPYTGRCSDTCSPGFYPPLCQDTYKYIAVPPTVDQVDYGTVTVNASLGNLTGRGKPWFYQLQFKELTSDAWMEVQPELISSGLVSGSIHNLQTGRQYRARVVLIDQDGNSYQGDLVPVTDFETLCQVPDSEEYHIQSDEITSTSFDVTWEYEVKSPCCPVTEFEVFLQVPRRQLHHRQPSSELSVSYRDLLPGQQYSVRVRAITKLGNAPFSRSLRVTTEGDAPGEVTDLKAAAGAVGELRVSWNPPRFTGGLIQRYLVEFQCLRLLSCSNPCTESAGQLETTSTSVVLSGLYSFAQYSVRVAAQAVAYGPGVVVISSTKYSESAVLPVAHPKLIMKLSDTSLAVQWDAPANCSGLNGFFLGYQYQLAVASQPGKPVVAYGSTRLTNASFTGLVPLTTYNVMVYVLTTGGRSSDRGLVITATTSPTTPEQVQNLEVYKRSRHMIGVRWAPPLRSFGELGSFSVSHRKTKEDAGAEVRVVIPPVHCVAWPELYCHTISRLAQDTNYTVTVQARNVKVSTDGSSTSVTTTTREGSPGPPVGLKTVNVTHNSFVLEWELPNLIDGGLRSFLVNVEEMDSVNMSDCCQYYPLRELPAQSELSSYSLEVTGLRAASTHTVSVSAKTIIIGTSANVTATTRPARPVLTRAPEVALPRSSEEALYTVTVHPSEEYPGLERTYLLLVLPPGDIPDTKIWDEDLAEQLESAVGESFYLVGEYEPDDIGAGMNVMFGTDTPEKNGTLGSLSDPSLTLGETYRVGVALVLDYCGKKNVGFLAGEPFVAS